MNQNQNNKQSSKKSTVLLVILGILIIIGIITFLKNTLNQADELTYEEFWSYIEEQKISEMELTPAGDDNINDYIITGKYQLDAMEKPKNFKIIYPQTVINEKILDVDAPYYGKIDKIKINQPLKINWPSILIIVSTVLIIGFGVIFFMKNVNGSNKQTFDFIKNRARLSRKVEKTFNDVAGCDEEKEELIEIIDFLKNPRKYQEIGARIPKGVILEGPPGTGKTLLAKAVAGEARVPFYSISGSDFVEMFVGVGASRVRDMFKTAKQNAPCIIFVDEIDAVGRQRGTGLGGGHDEREQTLNQLLVEMDGFAENSGVIVMAATNRVDILDPALLRPGRFDRHITISAPDLKSRVAILKVHARNKKLSPKINLEDIARRTPGFCGADIENVLNEAALLAARENRREIKIYDIDEAIDRVMAGPAKKSKKYTDSEKRRIAYHEAGHAVMGAKLSNSSVVQKVTIVPRGHSGGYNLMTPLDEKFNESKDELLEEISLLMGGRCAEEIACNTMTSGCVEDMRRATKIARAMVTQLGMSDLGLVQYEDYQHDVFLGRDYMASKNFSDAVALEIDNEIRKIFNECYETTKKTLVENRTLLDTISNYLFDIETLTREDINEIVETGKLQWWEDKKKEDEAKKIAFEKENELKEIYEKQLEAMKEAKKNNSNNEGK